jgi:hypothetical protein
MRMNGLYAGNVLPDVTHTRIKSTTVGTRLQPWARDYYAE